MDPTTVTAAGDEPTGAPPIAASRAYPGARRPDRSRWIDAGGLRLAAYEWGDPEAPVILAAHGGFDVAATFDLIAPRLADGGHRFVAWDARGHGCSEQAVLYSWAADVRDTTYVLDATGADRVVLLGHSKGAGVMLDLAHALPHRVSHLVNIDGLPSRNKWPDVADRERTRMMRGEFESWLAFRRKVADRQRRPGTLEELAARRHEMNPRLTRQWIEYLVSIGGEEQADGWRWRIDPSLRMGGFGPWRPEWSMQRLPGLGVPVLGLLGLEPEIMGFGTLPADVDPYLPPLGELVVFDDAGHFIHIEQPERTADVILDFLARHPVDGSGA